MSVFGKRFIFAVSYVRGLGKMFGGQDQPAVAGPMGRMRNRPVSERDL